MKQLFLVLLVVLGACSPDKPVPPVVVPVVPIPPPPPPPVEEKTAKFQLGNVTAEGFVKEGKNLAGEAARAETIIKLSK